MNRTTALCLAAVCFLSAGSATHADQITPISYNFNTSFAPIFVDHTFGGALLTNTSGVLPSNSGTISSNLATFSFASPSAPQHVSIPINLTLSDSQGHSQTLSMGTISGQLSVLGSNLSFAPSQSSITTTFDNKSFTFSSPNFSFSPGLLLSYGSLSFNVVDPPVGGTISSVGGSTAATPEPSSLLLAGVGVPLFGVFLRRRKR